MDFQKPKETSMKTVSRIIFLASILLASSAYSADAAMQMQEHMQHMDALMTEINNEQDPARLEVLMAQHMEMMHQGMTMMSQNNSSNADMNMDGRMKHMEESLQTMQMMMGQMMNHDEEERKRPIHQHKR
tara:strand:+ start:551 stop:940 length:390 start_codon:yes stop_codon:yes gene_type:complete